ncbi:MAG: HD domain-containing protein, partial [Christensenella sp.]
MFERHIECFFEAWSAAALPPCYIVGGFVRNQMLGYAMTDTDITSSAPPQAAEALPAPDFMFAEKAYGLGTVAILQRYCGETYVYEYTAFRKDNYGRGGEHIPQSVTFTEDMTEDAKRRDFTVNALYMDAHGSITDPTGRGKAAIKNKIIEQITQETLSVDALRILRMVRFAAELGFDVEAQTWESAKRNIGGLADISKERIRDEFSAILTADSKYNNKGGVLRALHMLKELGAFKYIIPELEAGEGMVQNTQYHAYDVAEHALRSCACAKGELITRMAALLHDIAKPMVFAETGKMYGHDKIGAQSAMEALKALRYENSFIAAVGELVGAHMFDLDNQAKKHAVARKIVKLGEEQFLRLCDVREADFCGSGMGAPALSAQKWRETLKVLHEQAAPMNISQLAINGKDLMRELKIPQGKRVGELLQALLVYALKKPTQNNYKNLLRYAKMIEKR